MDAIGFADGRVSGTGDGAGAGVGGGVGVGAGVGAGDAHEPTGARAPLQQVKILGL